MNRISKRFWDAHYALPLYDCERDIPPNHLPLYHTPGCKQIERTEEELRNFEQFARKLTNGQQYVLKTIWSKGGVCTNRHLIHSKMKGQQAIIVATKLAEKGLVVRNDARPGLWSITPEGRKYLD